MEKHTINIDVNTQKANADVDKLDKNFTDLNRTVENLAETMDMDLGAAISEIEDELTRLAVQGKQNTEEFKNLAQEAGRLKSVIAEVDAQVEFYGVTNADVGQKIGLLEDQLYRMAVAGDTTSEEFRRIQAEAAGLKQQITQVDMALDGMAMTTSQKLTGALGGVTGAFSTVQGAMGAFGVESEAVNEALLKVQSAMAITQGVDSIKQALPAMNALKMGAISAFNGMTTAGKAFALTGIGLVLTALAAAAASMDMFSSSTENAEEKQSKLEKQLEKTNKEIEDQKRSTESIITIIDDRTARELNAARRLGASEQELTNIKREANKERLKILKREADAASALYLRMSGSGTQKQYEAAEKAMTEATKAYSKLRIQIETEETDAVVEQRERAVEAAKTRREQAASLKKEELAKISEAQKEYDENERTRYMTEQEKEIYEVQKKYNELLAIAAKYGKDNTQILINQKNEENAINTKYEQERLQQQAERDAVIAEQLEVNRQAQLDAQEAFDETYRQNTLTAQQLEIDAANEKYFELISIAEQYGYSTVELKKRQEDELANIDKKYKEEAAAREKQLRDMRIDAVKGGIDAIGNLAGAFAGKSEKSQRRAFNIQKAAGIASATIDTYKSAQAAFASAGNPILGAVFAAIAVAAGIANITKIAKTKFEGGGGAGSVSTPSTTAGAGSITTPEFNIVGGNTANQLATLGQQPVQAYVVSGEVSSAQSLDRNRVQNATL